MSDIPRYDETDRYRRLVSGPVAAFLSEEESPDPLDLIHRVEVIEETLRHWMAHAVPYASLIDTSYELVAEQAKMISKLEAEVQSCHREALEVVAVLGDRLDDFEAWTRARTSRSEDVEALLAKSDRWCDHAQRFIVDR